MSKALLQTPTPVEKSQPPVAFTTEVPPDVNVITPPTHEEIAAEAYERHAAAGYPEGRDVEDWLEAEQALLERRADALRRRTAN